MDAASVRDLILQQFDAEEYDHFGKIAFRRKPLKKGAKPGKTFATLWPDEGHLVLVVNKDQQIDAIDRDPRIFRPHPSKWGEKGATIALLSGLNEKTLLEVIAIAFSNTK